MQADVAARDTTPNQAPDQVAALRLIERAGRLFAPTPAYHRRRAHYLERLGDITEAQRERQAADQVPLTGALDHFLLGDEQYQRGRLLEAQQSFSNAVGHDLPAFWADFYLAMCHLHRQQWDQARAELNVCCTQRRDFVWARLLRGYVLRELTAFDAAQGEFRAAEEILIRQPNTAAHYVLHVNRASLWLRQENLPEAEADFQRAETFLDDHPNHLARYVLHVNRGVLRLRQGRLDEAHAELQRAIALQPDQYLAYLNRASVFEKQQNAVAAAEQFRLALQRQPPALVLASYHAERGRELCQAHQYDACVAACQQALKHRGDCAQAHGILGQAFLALHRYQEAADSFDQYLQWDGPPKPDIYRGRGQARMDLKNFRGAADDYSHVLVLEPNDGVALTHRGWACFFAEDHPKAASDFERAIPLNRVNKDAWIGRGLVRVERGDYRAAVADAREALRQKTDRPEMLLNLACIFARAVACVLSDPISASPQQAATEYRNLALDLLDEALQRTPADERKIFWHDAVAKETWLDPIRATERFRQLQQRYLGR
jgi:tetratricopeptide (TPR) repeat protein